ncbi:hypothetical protein [Neisseria wadsworthii]|uniref:hypothetical protein n=1 Tax=Neisseria wadsworthii TaxID=607711 RepID=UPI0015F4A3D5|nr:hypothetical protein [Neisseria wadsworthii]QMT34804.1 hypothetical protein H3L96_06880 [Neisseria wadsworthii]
MNIHPDQTRTNNKVLKLNPRVYNKTTGGEPPMDDLLRRVIQLEHNLNDMKQDIAVIKACHASKEDMQKEIGTLKTEIANLNGTLSTQIQSSSQSQIKWMLGTILTVIALLISAIKLL